MGGCSQVILPIFIMSIRSELLNSGYRSDGEAECNECHSQVEVLSVGTKKAYFNLPIPGTLHSLTCGDKLDESQAESGQGAEVFR